MNTRIIAMFLLCSTVTTVSYAQTPVLFQDLYPGKALNSGVANLFFGTVHNDHLYFNVRDSLGTYDIYRTDGTTGGTILLKTIPQVANFHVYNNEVYFGFVDVSNGGSQLWKTDGAVTGTQMIQSFGGNSIAPNSFTVHNNRLYFIADTATTPQQRRLFISDGTASGTHILDPDLFEAGSSFSVINNKLLFAASSDPDSPMSKEPYITDGTPAGTVLLKDVNPGTAGSNPAGFVTYNGKVYFSATTGAEGTELWVTDGTAAGTDIVKDLNAGIGNGLPFTLSACVYDNKLFFAGDDGVAGRELFVTDGTASGTQLVKDIAAGASGSNVSNLIAVNGKLLFCSNDGTSGSEVWSSDGTASGTSLLKDINAGVGSGVYALLSVNLLCADRLYFDADNGNSNIEPWVTDGTVSGTVQLGEINTNTTTPGSVDYETRYLRLNDNIYFAAFEPATGRELYTLPDTCATTAVVALQAAPGFDIFPNPASHSLTVSTGGVQGSVLSIYNTTGMEVYRYKPAGTAVKLDITHLASGVYTVVLQTGSGRAARKLVVY